MSLAAVERVATTPRPEFTASADSAIAAARKLLAAEPCSPLVHLLQWAGRRGYGDLEFSVTERRLRATARARRDSEVREPIHELLWLLAALEDCEEVGVGVCYGCHLDCLLWKGREVRGGSEARLGDLTLEVYARLKPRPTGMLSHYADKDLEDRLGEGLEKRARFYPGQITVRDKLWTRPLDFDLVDNCYFTSYTLVDRDDPGGYFMVAHPWSHGARFFLSADGAVVDLFARSGEDATQAPGNFWHAPGLIPAVARRLGLFRNPTDNGIDVSVPRTWGRNSYLVGGDEYLLSPCPTRYGKPPTPITLRPLRVRQLFLQEDRAAACDFIIPVQNGVAFDNEIVPHQPGGMTAVLDCPDDLPVKESGFALLNHESKTLWIQANLEEFQRRHSLIQ